MKALMRRGFVPRHYYKELHQSLQMLMQGTKSVDEYFKEIEIAMIRINVEEDNEGTIARFLWGLNLELLMLWNCTTTLR